MTGSTAPILVISGPSGVGKSTVSGLVVAAIDPSAHIRTDVFLAFITNGWVEPWLPEAAHQNRVIGGAFAAAAMELALGGYTVVLDGHLFPEGITGLAPWSARRGVTLHYAVLRADLEVCVDRAENRVPETQVDRSTFVDLHARFADLGAFEAHAIDASGDADDLASEVLTAFRSGRLAV